VKSVGGGKKLVCWSIYNMLASAGTDVMILKIFSPKNLAKHLALCAQTAANCCKNLIITLVFEKNANFVAENWQKSRKL
jgi:hypothetical protein